MSSMRDKIIWGDCINVMEGVDGKSIPLIIADPPYNIGKAEWDKIPNYLEWCGKWLKAVERIMADNGSLYIFHNDMPVIAKLMDWIESNTKLVFKQMVVWNKRFDGMASKGFMDGFVVTNDLRNYQKMVEYLLFYTFQDETGLSRIYDSKDCFKSIKDYLRMQKKESRLNGDQINEVCGVASMAGRHFFCDSQWCLPTAEMYAKLQTTGFFRKPYEDLRMEYEDLRYTFNNQKTDHSVWNYETVKKAQHPTQKPVDLIENIIRHSSNEDDLVLDPFAGVGSAAIAAIRNNRHFIGIERDARYCLLARNRIRQSAKYRLIARNRIRKEIANKGDV